MAHYQVELTIAEREFLEQQISDGKFKATRLRRAQILLGVDEHNGRKKMTMDEVVQAYGCSRGTVRNTRRRFVEEGFELALNGSPRPVNRKSKIDGRAQSHLIALRCSDPPAGESRWTLRLLGENLVELGYVDSISPQGVSDILKKLPSNPGE